MKNNSADWLTAFASPYPAAPDFPPVQGEEQPVLKVESLIKR